MRFIQCDTLNKYYTYNSGVIILTILEKVQFSGISSWPIGFLIKVFQKNISNILETELWKNIFHWESCFEQWTLKNTYRQFILHSPAQYSQVIWILSFGVSMISKVPSNHQLTLAIFDCARPAPSNCELQHIQGVPRLFFILCRARMTRLRGVTKKSC